MIAAAVERTGIDPAEIDDVYWGAANQAGEDNRNVARMASLLAGLPDEVPGRHRQPALRLRASRPSTRRRARSRLGEADLVAGRRLGVDEPRPLGDAEARDAASPRGAQTYDTALGWRLINPRMAERYSTESMGETAENVAERYGVTPRRPGRLRAAQPPARGRRAGGRAASTREMVPVSAAGRGGETRVDRDEGPRADTTLERLAALRPAFREGGTVTAGNASTHQRRRRLPRCSASDEARASSALEPLGARRRERRSPGVDPDYMGIGPVPAIRRALDARRAASWTTSTWSRSTRRSPPRRSPASRELGIDAERLNVNGGAIALGHPLGCSGAPHRSPRCCTACAAAAPATGVAALCVGVGQGLATVIENVSP